MNVKMWKCCQYQIPISNWKLATLVLATLATMATFAKTFDVDISTGRPAASNEAYYHGETIEFRAVRGRSVVTNVEYSCVYYQTNGMDSVWWHTDGLVFHPTNDVGAASYRFFMEGRDDLGRDWHANGLLRLLPSPGFTPNTIELPVARLDFAAVDVANAPWTDPDYSTNNTALVETIEATAPAPGNYAVVSNAAVYAAITNALQDAELESHASQLSQLSQSLDGKVPTSRTVNGQPLTNNVALTGSDIAVSSNDTTKIDAALAGKLDKSGGTMTGQLTVQNAAGLNFGNTVFMTAAVDLQRNRILILHGGADPTVNSLMIPVKGGTTALVAANPTAGNLAALDANGNPTDSGIKPSDKANRRAFAQDWSVRDWYEWMEGDWAWYNGLLYRATRDLEDDIDPDIDPDTPGEADKHKPGVTDAWILATLNDVQTIGGTHRADNFIATAGPREVVLDEYGVSCQENGYGGLYFPEEDRMPRIVVTDDDYNERTYKFAPGHVDMEEVTVAIAAGAGHDGNLAALDAHGNPTDSQIPASNVALTSDIAGKQDKLPYATNAIPYAVISGKPTIPPVPTAQINAATTTNALQDTTLESHSSQLSQLSLSLDGKVPTSRTINGKALTSNISLSASEVGATTAEDVYRIVAGTNVVLVVTNYNSAVHVPAMKLQHLDPDTGEYITYWDETCRHGITLTNAMNYADAVAQTRAPAAWCGTTSGLGQEAPAGVTWVSTPETVIAGGYEYEKVITTSGAVWILTSNGLAVGATTNSYFRVSATDGTELFSIEKTDSYLVGVNADGITRSGNTITIPINVVANTHPYIRATTNLVNAVWTKEDENGFSCPFASVSWSGTSGAYVATVTCAHKEAFFYFEFMHEGTAKIRQNAKTELTGGIYFNGNTYMPTVSGNELKFIRQ